MRKEEGILHKKIYELRIINTSQKSKNEKLKNLYEIYMERIEMFNSINKAADSLGIPRTTFRDQVKRNLTSFYRDFLKKEHNPH